MNAQQAVETLLDPISVDEFLSTWYERRPLHVRASDPSRHDRWFTMHAFTDLLGAMDASVLKLRSAHNGKMNSDVTLRQALDDYHEGGTLIANLVQFVHPPLGTLCRLLEAFFHQNFQVNAYLQPAGQRGFGAHVETHDEFNLQIHGRKSWKVYGFRTELPALGPEFPLQLDPAMEPLFEAVTEPGDLMYIPRGFFHGAAATDDGPSLHLTVGMVPVTWRDLLVQAVVDAGERHVALRRQVPMGPHVTKYLDGAAEMEQALQAVIDEVRHRAVPDAERRFAISRSAVLPCTALAGTADPMGPDSPVRRDPLVVAVLEKKADYLVLSFHGRTLSFPIEVEAILRAMLACDGTWTVRDLPPAIDETNRLRLVQHLVEQGLLTR